MSVLLRPQPAELPWDPAKMDVICDQTPVYFGSEWTPAPAKRRTNITQEIFPGGHVGFAWGDSSLSSYVLSLCILDRFLPWTVGDAAVYRTWRCLCSPMAAVLTDEFHLAAIATMPWGGGVLRGEWIRRWIDDHKECRPDRGIYLEP